MVTGMTEQHRALAPSASDKEQARKHLWKQMLSAGCVNTLHRRGKQRVDASNYSTLFLAASQTTINCIRGEVSDRKSSFSSLGIKASLSSFL